ncbi:MAG: mechanosensitive ion channel family protein [Candidatus Pacearchaeota archaeon]|jgi:MscS family membrane protein
MIEQYIPNDYLRALATLIVLLFAIRVALYFIEKIFLKLTSKTKTNLDDKLIQKASKPLTILALLIALRISIIELALRENYNLVALNIIHSAIIIVLAYLIYAFVNIIVITAIKKAARKTKSRIDDSLISLFESVLQIALILITFLYILNLWGIEITPLLAGLGIAGLAVALALQPILSNIFSGAAIILDHSVRVGDLVYLDAQTKGKIDKIGLRSTRIKTFDNELIIVPNNKLADSTIQNVALPEPKTRVVVPFGVAYGSNIEKVKKLILTEIKKLKHIVKDDDIKVRFLEMADSSLNFKAYFYVDSFENRISSIDEANTKIYNTLNKNKIEIPFPQTDIHIRK